MTNQQINRAIAEACGWGWFQKICTGELLGKPFEEKGPLRSIPDYCTDLNAMHEAEKVLTVPQEKDYFANLEEIVGDLMWTRSSPKSHRATAKERAEAFLRAINKWQATDKDSFTVGATAEESSVDHLRDATKMMERKQP